MLQEVREKNIYEDLILKYSPEEVQEVFEKNRCYESIYKLSFSYPFRLDINKKEIYFIGPLETHFKVQSVMGGFPEDMIRQGMIHEDDIHIFRRITEKMYKGEKTTEVFRVYTKEGKILWYQVNYLVNEDEEGNLVEIIGEFVNVQEKKELEIKLHTDELTGCLNKATFHTLVNEELQNCYEKEKHVLLIVDVDNFKAINDNLGHQFGDSVLREAGTKLKKFSGKKIMWDELVEMNLWFL